MYSIRRCVPTFVVLLVLVSQQLLSQTPSQEPPASPQSISGTGSRPKQTKPNCTDNGTYVNSRGQTVKRPENCSSTPQGATAQCRDRTYSFSKSRRGTCSHHGGVAKLVVGLIYETPSSFASACQCLGCGIRLPVWMSDEYGSLTPKIERICDFATLTSAG